MNPYYSNPTYFIKRREEIIKDKDKGMSNADLVKKYDISQTRILQIVKKFRKKAK